MRKTLGWIIVFGLNWEPPEENEAEYINQILSLNVSNIENLDCAYIPCNDIENFQNEIGDGLDYEYTYVTFFNFPDIEEEVIKSFIEESFAPAFIANKYELSFQNFYTQDDDINGIIAFVNIADDNIIDDNIIANKQNSGWHMKQHVKRRERRKLEDISKKHLSPMSLQNDQNEKISFLEKIGTTQKEGNQDQDGRNSFIDIIKVK